MADEAKIEQLVKSWLSYDKFANSRKEIETLWEQKNLKELQSRLAVRIDFGTAGLRAKMAAGFACMNELIIVQTTQGLCAYMEETDASLKQKGVVIGYDGRYNSKTYAELTAAVFLSRGFKVILFPTMCPTPFVPYAVRHLGLGAGIMVTASHNPKQDNGYKLYWSNGCQIISPIDSEVSIRIMKNLTIWDNVDISCKSIYSNALLSQDVQEIIDSYYASIVKLYCFEKAANPFSGLQVTYTAMHGVGAPWVTRALKEFNLPHYIPVAAQVDADPEFPTVQYPNPEEGKGALKLAMETAEKANSRLIIANDPDADRLAVAEQQPDGTWRIFNGNEIALLFAHWAWINYVKQNPNVDKKKCFMLASTVSSKILRAMAHVEGFHFEDTLTGFKWIGNRADALIKQGMTFIFGFEVEIGFLVGDLSLDKDGVRTAAIFNEMAKHVYQHSFSLSHHLDNLYKKYGYYVMRTRYFFTPTVETVATVMNNIRVINGGTYPTQCGEFKIKHVRDLTVGFDNSQPDNKPVLPVSASNQMITFSFEDGSTCTLRNSGTEPKLKYYMECADETRDKATARVEALKQAVIQELMQPQKFGLVPPKDE